MEESRRRIGPRTLLKTNEPYIPIRVSWFLLWNSLLDRGREWGREPGETGKGAEGIWWKRPDPSLSSCLSPFIRYSWTRDTRPGRGEPVFWHGTASSCSNNRRFEVSTKASVDARSTSGCLRFDSESVITSTSFSLITESFQWDLIFCFSDGITRSDWKFVKISIKNCIAR